MNKPSRFLINLRHCLAQWRFLLGITLLLGSSSLALGDITSDVANTRHNLSANNPISTIPGSSFGTTVVKAADGTTGTTQICVFCHTPHGAKSGTAAFVAPLWNRTLSPDATYTQFYDSKSLDANPKPGSTGVGVGSKLCLSCHDGTVAIGTVGVLNNASGNIAMQGTSADGTMPPGKGENTGFTRRIGTNLSNDHPISFTYNEALATADGELNKPGGAGVAVAGRVRGQPKPQFPLIVPVGSTDSPAVQRLSGQMECITCHDPHLKSDALDPVTFEPINNKFLRGNRFQLVSPTPTSVSTGTITSAYDPSKDIICLACHNKPTWATSTHANAQTTSERYTNEASDLRDFPRDITVWQAACANCHDMHTVPGARRLLREGINSPFSPKAGNHTDPDGKLASVEQVCFQCHSPETERILVKESPDQVPDIKTAFGYKVHMPIVTAEQGSVPIGGGATDNTTEIHNIGIKTTDSLASYLDDDFSSSNAQRGKDFMELRSQMGAGNNLRNRHAECTDCHQPHRVTRTVLFNGDPTIPAEKGTHRHGGLSDVGNVAHNNLASGSQRGQFGVEPVYGSNSFYAEPSSFVEKRGAVNTYSSVTAVNFPDTDTGSNNGITNVYDVDNTYLTREYQVCAKCHSNYAFGNLQGSIANPTNIPPLGRTGGTPSGTNGMMFYTNIFREIQAPVTHRGEASSIPPAANDSGAFSGIPPYTAMGDPALRYTVDFRNNNHRSWHPVMGPTGRTPSTRNADASNWLPPWESVGNQTMYCTDCHGSKTPAGLAQQAVDGEPEGPHGSDNIFMLKGWWDNCTGSNNGLDTCLTTATGSATVDRNQDLNPAATRPTSTAEGDLCFKCHSFQVYGEGSAIVPTAKSGFSGTEGVGPNGHKHRTLGGKKRCMWCHVAVPHGWKNKALLVNLNDVGPEATCRQEDDDDAPVGYKCSETVGIGNPMPPGTQVRDTNMAGHEGGYNNPPYYRNAMLKIEFFAASGAWKPTSCGSVGNGPNDPTSGTGGNGCAGWMVTNSGCNSLP